MAIEIVEGTMQPADPVRVKRGYALFSKLRITQASGNVREFSNISTGPGVADEVALGGQGQFYFTSSGGAKGMFGIHRPDGAAHYAHFTNVEKLLIVTGGLCSLGTIARFGFDVGFPLFGAIIGPIVLAMGLYLDNQRKAALRVFQADGG